MTSPTQADALARRRECLVMRAELQRLALRHDLAALRAQVAPWADLGHGVVGLVGLVGGAGRRQRSKTFSLVGLALAAWRCWRMIRPKGRQGNRRT
ncbi:hypothetical protein [Ideonella sp.]|uniref:hypothetical protein n=1 Tax=Ideonella sp. TaxID=1929293 RepID=UPI0035B4A864